MFSAVFAPSMTRSRLKGMIENRRAIGLQNEYYLLQLTTENIGMGIHGPIPARVEKTPQPNLY